MINGPKSTCEIINLNIAYQIRRNVFMDLGGTYCKYKNNSGIYVSDLFYYRAGVWSAH